MFPLIRSSVVQTTPVGFQYATYTLSPSLSTLSSSKFTRFPSTSTTSTKGTTLSPAPVGGEPFIVTRPEAMRASAARRECVERKHLLRRIDGWLSAEEVEEAEEEEAEGEEDTRGAMSTRLG
eukprot:CAMPEP_0182470394 /NCGR_PEP_ID=MMETSP1319-20130603/18642_1 /TAXON_ID=172717 /ORGANISM="Bolidomonas pacifica, Strain RCC208" /LENGTH=121 /DNA_ID=CAMNT_0024670833 /DNA_START=465 /DNA_END=830 /DNA_ORIENTATION=+